MRDYTLSELRKMTESYVSQVKGYLSESLEYPTYDEIKAAYNPSSDSIYQTEKIVPSMDLLTTAYRIFNREFFGGVLPENLFLDLMVEPNETRYGSAGYRVNRITETLIPTMIRLNTRYRMTFHEWLEVILHECVHIFEYVTHPEPFIETKKYDAHGPWFLAKGAEFDQYGFHVRKYVQSVKGTYEINVDNPIIAKRYNKIKNDMLIARLIGVEKAHNGAAVKISRAFKPKLEFIADSAKRGSRNRWTDVEKIEYYTTDNPNAIDLKRISPRDAYSSFRYKFFDFAEKNYGPFTLESEFVPGAIDTVSTLKAEILSPLNSVKLSEKILRFIVGRDILTEWEFENYAKYVKPVIKLSNGISLGCKTYDETKGNGDRIKISSDFTNVLIGEAFMKELTRKYKNGLWGGMVMDEYYSLRDDEMYGGKIYSKSEAINRAIDSQLENNEFYTNEMDGAKAEIKTILEEMASKLNEKGNDNMMKNESVVIEEDIDELDVEDRNLNDDEYARRIWDNISGVEDVKVNGDGTVDVTIW